MGSGIDRLLEIMRRLRAPEGGCPWDREQTFATIAPYTIEEAYEVADAIERQDPQQIRDELGDLLFQVVFHAELATEQGWFDFEAVASAICEKLQRRHPHVFADAPAGDAATQARAWEAIKAGERVGRADSSRLADLPRALPALSRARKLGVRAAGIGFDFPDVQAARAKLDEELLELEVEVAADPSRRDPRIAEEYGDVLFSVVNLGRKLGLDPESCLKAANEKFETRFRGMERVAAERGIELSALSAAEWDALWVEVK